MVKGQRRYSMVGAILPDYISEFIDDFENKLKVKKVEAGERAAEKEREANKESK